MSCYLFNRRIQINLAELTADEPEDGLGVGKIEERALGGEPQ